MHKPTETIKGVAAIAEMLDHIGIDPDNDPRVGQAIRKIVVENEMNLLALLTFAMGAIADEMR
jgi:hypothetical protein